MTGTAISGSLTKFGITGENFWQGKSHKNVWWNSYQSRWDGLLPYDEAGGLSAGGDFYVAGDVDGTIDWTMGVSNASVELEVRASGRPTIYWDDSGKTLHCVSFHDTTTYYWEVTYNSTTDEYTIIVDDETVTGIARSAGGAVHTGSMIKVPNGDVWVALLTDSGLELNRRTGGSWNASAVNLDSALNSGAVTLNYFTNGGTTYVYVFASEDDLNATQLWAAYYIDEDHSTPFTNTNWTDDSPVAQTVLSTDADNHIDSVRDSSDNIYIVGKTGNAATGEALIFLLDRTPAGTYTGNTVSAKAASVDDDRSRPCVAWDSTNDKIVIAYSNQNVVSGEIKSYEVNADVSDLSTWSSESDLFSVATDIVNNVRSPQQDFAATSTTGILFLAEHTIDATADRGDEVYHNLQSVAVAETQTYSPVQLPEAVQP